MIKNACVIALFLMSFSLQAKNSYFEIGAGSEYSGIGVQGYLPTESRYFEFYMSAGVLSKPKSNPPYASMGFGINAYPVKNLSIGLHSVVKEFGGDKDNSVGASINAKYHFSDKKGESGLSLGVSYVVDADSGYPFIGIGYRI
jgi:hypothetical protein